MGNRPLSEVHAPPAAQVDPEHSSTPVLRCSTAQVVNSSTPVPYTLLSRRLPSIMLSPQQRMGLATAIAGW
jgi:hypothetical protein